MPFSPAAAYLFFDAASHKQWTNLHTEKINNAQNSMMQAAPAIFVLSQSGNLQEAASNLFAMLHTIDSLQTAIIHAQAAPNHDLGAAINDRLSRASCRE
jgi:hypothetical protein